MERQGHSEMTTAGTQKMDPSVDGAWVPPATDSDLFELTGLTRSD